MTAIDVYLWGLGGIAAVAGVCGLLGWRNGMPFVSTERNGIHPNDVIDLVGTILCYGVVWPYLLFLGGCALWQRLRSPGA
jgi:hypothetical protein